MREDGPAPRFAERIAVVAGGAHGIGLATALRLGLEGARLAIADHNTSELRVASVRLGDAGVKHWTYDCDLSQPDHVAALHDRVEGDLGPVDLVFTSVGRLDVGSALELPLEAWQRTYAVNVTSALLLARAFVPDMRAAGSGAMVLTSSTSGLGGERGLCAYNTTKGALIQLGRQLAVEYAADGIRVNVLCPGWIDGTDFNRPVLDTMTQGRLQELVQQSVPLGRQGTPAEVAAAACFLLSPDAAYITGHVLCVDGGERAL